MGTSKYVDEDLMNSEDYSQEVVDRVLNKKKGKDKIWDYYVR